jgi:hypothetical protein
LWCRDSSGRNLFDDASNTYASGLAFFNAYRTGQSEVHTLTMTDADNVLGEIDAMVEKGLSPITIYIIAHGDVDRVRLGGVWITAQQFRDEFAEHPRTLFNLVVGSCYGASFIDDLSSLSNVPALLTACSTTGLAAPDWDTRNEVADYNPDDSGSEWTSSLLTAAAAMIDSHWDDILDYAAAENVPVTSVLLDAAGLGALGQRPDFGLTEDLDLSHRLGIAVPACCGYWGTSCGSGI